MRIAIFCLFSLLMLSSPASSNENLDANAIRAQQAAIQADAMARTGRYKDMSDSNLQALRQHQELVAAMLGNVNMTTELSEVDQIAVFNELEAISAIINRAEDERMVCERYRPVGTNRPTTVCRTVAQRRADKELAEQSLRRDSRCADSSGSGDFCRN